MPIKTDQAGLVSGSFRDPNGFVFSRDGQIYRQINRRYKENYDHLIDSGLYDTLVHDDLLIPHTEVGIEFARTEDAYKVIRPAPICFVSYPYEWCFSQLKHAALLTLQIQQRALDFGMSLKDSSAYNIQFANGKPILIDTLSFEKYQEGKPWVAYRQFCQHFLAPLLLMSTVDVRLSQLLRVHLDGIPLDLASALLPVRTRLNPSLLMHIHLHAKAQKRFAEGTPSPRREGGVGQTAFRGLIDSLRSVVERSSWQPGGTQWHDYYSFSSYSSAALENKRRLVAEMLDQVRPKPTSVWDLGANVGLFSRIASERGIPAISFDIDPGAVETNYLESVAKGEANILPLVLDLTNPSPGLGWENQERMSLPERGPADVVFALAFIHHLAISNNVPLRKLAVFFSRFCNWLIIEFVPQADSQVQKLLSIRQDIFEDYSQRSFELQFSECFTLKQQEPITDTDRTLYLMAKKGHAE